MIKDSGKKLFDVVLVWKFDRFARNRFDSANYKMILKKNGVHLISVMEPIAEGSQGILVETLLEGMAEYYSAELSEKVIRGQTENALKGKCTGGTGTIGYKIDDDKFYHLDPLTAPLVLEAFQRYDNGDKMVEIVNFLNDKGVRNMLGGKMTHSSVNTMLKNRRYIGELSFRDIVVPDAIPVIVPKDLFDRVQKRLDKNKRAPACGKADEEYLLTTKLFCGKCGALMFGESGTSATGRTYYYCKCANVKRCKGCNKKTVQKDWLEDLVVRETMKLIQDDAVIDKIVQLVMDVQNQENNTIPLLEKQLREVNKKLDNLMKAIEDGLYTRTMKERLEALEAQKDELTAKIADEKLKKPSFNEDFIRFWLMKFRKIDISGAGFQHGERLYDCFDSFSSVLRRARADTPPNSSDFLPIFHANYCKKSQISLKRFSHDDRIITMPFIEESAQNQCGQAASMGIPVGCVRITKIKAALHPIGSVQYCSPKM